MKIGEFFGHKCSLLDCYPDYLNYGVHRVVYDEKTDVYRDASVYRYYFDINRKKWVFDRYPSMNNVPELSLRTNPIPNT